MTAHFTKPEDAIAQFAAPLKTAIRRMKRERDSREARAERYASISETTPDDRYVSERREYMLGYRDGLTEAIRMIHEAYKP